MSFWQTNLLLYKFNQEWDKKPSSWHCKNLFSFFNNVVIAYTITHFYFIIYIICDHTWVFYAQLETDWWLTFITISQIAFIDLSPLSLCDVGLFLLFLIPDNLHVSSKSISSLFFALIYEYLHTNFINLSLPYPFSLYISSSKSFSPNLCSFLGDQFPC